jgi:hypothetical protein
MSTCKAILVPVCILTITMEEIPVVDALQFKEMISDSLPEIGTMH